MHQLNKTTRLENSLGHDLKFLVSNTEKMMTEGELPVERPWPWAESPRQLILATMGNNGEKSWSCAEKIILCSVCNFGQNSWASR